MNLMVRKIFKNDKKKLLILWKEIWVLSLVDFWLLSIGQPTRSLHA